MVVQVVAVVRAPVRRRIPEPALRTGGGDVCRSPADVAGAVPGGDGDPVGRAVRRGQGRGDGSGLAVVGKGQGRAVIGDGHGGLGQYAVHIVLYGAGEGGAADLGGDRGHGGIHGALKGGGNVVDVDRPGPSGVAKDLLEQSIFIVNPGGRRPNTKSLEAEPIAGGHRDLLPAGEIQRGNRRLQVALRTVVIEQIQIVAGAVAIDPQVQARIEFMVNRRLAGRPPLRLVEAVLCQGIVQPAGATAHAHGLCRRGTAELESVGVGTVKDGGLLLKVLHRLDGEVGHRHLHRGAPSPGGDSDRALSRHTGGEVSKGVNGSDPALYRPGKGLRVRLQLSVLVGGGGGQLRHAAGGSSQRGEGGAVGAADGQGIRGSDGVDRRCPRSAAAAGGNGDVAAGAGGNQHIALQLTAIGLQTVVLLHGNKVGVYSRGGDLYLAARQHILVIRLNIEVAQLSGGLARRHQQHLVGNLPLPAVGGPVGGIRLQLVRRGDGQRGGAAAIQAQRRVTAQLDHAVGHLVHGRAHRVPGAAAVNGVENHSAVIAHAHGGSGIGAGGQARHHGAVRHQGVQRAHGVFHVVPLLAGGGGLQRDNRAHGDPPQGLHVVGVGF